MKQIVMSKFIKIIVVSAASCFLLVAIGVSAADMKINNAKDGYNLFRTLLGRYVSVLNANQKSGEQGAYEYIINGRISTSTIQNWVSTRPALKINELLDRFRSEFIKNTGSELNGRDKEGIKQAMIARFTELCNIGFKDTASSTALRAYRNELKSAANVLKTAIGVCEVNYRRYLITNGSGGEVLQEFGRIEKDNCVNAAYQVYYSTSATLYNTRFGAAKTNLTTCIENAKSPNNWGWAQ
jgi:hypothetical protein